MTKKTVIVAAALLGCMLLATNGFAVTGDCSGFTKANIQYIGVGSSAQFNSFAFAAEALLTTGPNFWASGTFPLQDVRDGSNTFKDTAKVWVAWDNASDCTV